MARAHRHPNPRKSEESAALQHGEADVVPTPEAAPRRPLAPYGQSKAAAEDYCALFVRLHDLPAVSLRYANVYGPRQDPLGESGVIAIFCERAARRARDRVRRRPSDP